MKTFLTAALIITFSLRSSAQKPGYETTMKQYVAMFDTATTASSLQDAANKFERVAQAESQEWLPSYYAALCYLTISFMEKDVTKIDVLADKADALIEAAVKLAPNEAEIYVLKGLSASARIMVDPMNRGRQYGPLAGSHYDKALAINSANPRAWLLKAQGAAYTPVQFGGGYATAQPICAKAIELFQNDQPQTSIFPHWGLKQAEDLMAAIEAELTPPPLEKE